MSGKINVLGIVRAHFLTLHHRGRDEVSIIDLTVFFVCPILVAIVLFVEGDSIPDSLVSAMINAAAILLGLLLNLLVLMFDQKNRAKESLRRYKPTAEGGDNLVDANGDQGKLDLRIVVIDETVANISFTVLLCIISLCTLLFHSARRSQTEAGVIECVIYAVNAFIWISVLLTILMVIRRVFALFIQDA